MAGIQQRAPLLTTGSRPDVWSFTRAGNLGWERGILCMGYHVGSVIRSVFMWYRLQYMVKLDFCLITIWFLLKSPPLGRGQRYTGNQVSGLSHVALLLNSEQELCVFRLASKTVKSTTQQLLALAGSMMRRLGFHSPVPPSAGAFTEHRGLDLAHSPFSFSLFLSPPFTHFLPPTLLIFTQ